jgi:O-succinylbenzoate synthase
MPLRAEFETSFARVAQREMVIVALEADGLVGWGEAPVARRPHFSAETTETARHVLRDFILPAIVGAKVADEAALLARFAWVRGHRMARAAVESAFLDLLAKAAGEPLAKRLGAARGAIEVGVSLGIPKNHDLAALLSEVEQRRAEGYCRVKVKIRPGFDRAPLEAIRARFPDLPLAADANGAYREAGADLLLPLDDLGLVFLEQPLSPPDLCGHARLAARLRTPVCLDESLDAPEDLEAAIALGSCRVVNLKPARVGGPQAALAVRDLAAARGLDLWCGGMLETGIGRAHNVALAATPGFTMPADLSASDRYWEEDIVEPPFRLLPGGRLAVPQGPGIGVEVVRERIERATVALDVIEA